MQRYSKFQERNARAFGKLQKNIEINLDDPKQEIILDPFDASVTQLAECHLAKVDVEGSNPFARTIASWLRLSYFERQF